MLFPALVGISDSDAEPEVCLEPCSMLYSMAMLRRGLADFQLRSSPADVVACSGRHRGYSGMEAVCRGRMDKQAVSEGSNVKCLSVSPDLTCCLEVGGSSLVAR